MTSNKPKTAGRNSAGRITAFHRGGGSKRLYRKIDLKRNTPSIGVVERIEYDPNRSSNIALVRWSEGMHPLFQRKPRTTETFTPPSEILAPKEANIRGVFSFSSMSKETNQGTVSCFSTRPKATSVVVGLSTEPALSKGSLISHYPGNKISVNDVFLSAFSQKATGEPLSSSSSSVSLPRVAVAGAKPAFYAPVMRGNGGVKNTFSLGEIKKWNSSSSVWAHRLKRKAAVSWHCSRSLHSRGLAGIVELVKQKS